MDIPDSYDISINPLKNGRIKPSYYMSETDYQPSLFEKLMPLMENLRMAEISLEQLRLKRYAPIFHND